MAIKRKTLKRKILKRKTLKQRMRLRYKGGAAEEPSNNAALITNDKDLLKFALRKLSRTIQILGYGGSTNVQSSLKTILNKINGDSVSYNRPDIVLKQIKTIVYEILKGSRFIPLKQYRLEVLSYVSQIINSQFADFTLEEKNAINLVINQGKTSLTHSKNSPESSVNSSLTSSVNSSLG